MHFAVLLLDSADLEHKSLDRSTNQATMKMAGKTEEGNSRNRSASQKS